MKHIYSQFSCFLGINDVEPAWMLTGITSIGNEPCLIFVAGLLKTDNTLI